MKLTITMKDPDGFLNSIDRNVMDHLDTKHPELSGEDREEAFRRHMDKLKEDLKKWFNYNELVTLEIDTFKGTCTVAPNKP